jgi:hypothetical protein
VIKEKAPTFLHLSDSVCLQHAMQAYIDEGRRGQTVRHYYYKLLSSGAITLLPHHQTSGTNASNYVSRLLSEARKNGSFPWDAVVDNGRRSSTYWWYTDMDEYVRTESRSGYILNPWRGQKQRLEIFVENDGLLDMVESYVDQWRISVRVAKGYSSTTINKNAANRYGTGRGWTIFYLGDFDPSGLDIERNLKDELRDLGVRPDIQRVALTQEDTYTLPDVAAVDIKTGDPRAKGFSRRYGDDQKGYEIEALPVSQFRQKILRAIAPYIDVESFQEAVELERLVKAEAAARLEASLSDFAAEIYDNGVAGSSLALDEQLRYFKPW